MRRLVILLASLAAVGAWAQAPAPVREGNMERLVLDGGTEAEAKGWYAAEMTVTADALHTQAGPSSIHAHVPVDWYAGEAKYPVGWPRWGKRFPAALQDWSGYDYLEFSIYVTSSRAALPRAALGLGISNAKGRSLLNRELNEVKLGQWVSFRLPLSLFDSSASVAGLQFHISESNYKHGDTVDFWINRLSLVRYAESTLADSRLAEEIILGDSKYLLLEVSLLGIARDARETVTWQLLRASKPVATGQVVLGRGLTHCVLPLPASGLPEGSFMLVLKCAGSSSPPLPLRVVASPWQEVR